jgi:hypothetical protein
MSAVLRHRVALENQSSLSSASASQKGLLMNEIWSGNNLRGLAAELIATFTFIFMGVGAIGVVVGAGFTLVSPTDNAGL